jgi:hypothetical protein
MGNADSILVGVLMLATGTTCAKGGNFKIFFGKAK